MTRPRRFLILVGTDHHPFDRAVAWADARQRSFPDDDVLVQHGLTAAPAAARGVAFLTRTELRRAVADADVVITHGGPGTISDARRGGHRPIVFPRNPALGEHVDDHQRRFAPWCAQRGLVLLGLDTDELDARVAELPQPGTRIEGTRSDGAPAAVAAFAELVARPLPRGREPVAVDAPQMLHLVGDDAVVGAAEQRLAERPGTLVMGTVVRDWPRAAAGDGSCVCGLSVWACPFWSAVGQRAFGGWDAVDLVEVEALADAVSGAMSGRAARRHPGRDARERLLTYAGFQRAVFDAARTTAGSGLLVMRGDPGLALVLSHDRHLDLRVADLGAGVGPRLAWRHRRIPVDRWPDPRTPGWTAQEPRLLDGWAAPTSGTPLHGPDVSLRTARD